MRNRIQPVAFGLITTLLAASTAWSQAWFQGIGDLPGGEIESYAYGISGNGEVVVGLSISGSGPEACSWTAGSLVGLGDLGGETFASRALGASFDGSIIVGWGTDDIARKACVWQSGLINELPGLSNDVMSEAADVSADGSIIVGWSDSTADEQAVIWQNGVASPLDDLSNTTYTSQAYGVSADGQTVAGWRAVSFSFEAFVWSGGSMSGLPFLPGGIDGQAFGVSADGSHQVGYSMNSTITIEAAVWHNGTVTGLGVMPGGSLSQALDVSANGEVVVGSGDTTFGVQAFIWDAKHGIRAIRDVLTQKYGLDLTGWILEEAHAVSDDGRTIAGTGKNPAGDSEGWVAYLPPFDIADFDENGSVDAADYALFRACWSGANVPVVPGCEDKDLDGDNDVDAADLAIFQQHITEAGSPPNLISAVSRRTHGQAGNFDINLPLAPAATGIECRSGGPTRIVLTFSSPVVAADNILDASEIGLSAGTLGTVTTDGSQITINLSGVPDMTCLTVSLGTTITDLTGRSLAGTRSLSVRVLLGDTNASGSVSVADVNQTRSRSGQVSDATNFRSDTNCSGSISVADVNQVRSRSGNAVTCP